MATRRSQSEYDPSQKPHLALAERLGDCGSE
jgi:hypothetical protein